MLRPSPGRVRNSRTLNCLCPAGTAARTLGREYGFAGWQQLLAEVQNRLGQGLEWAAYRARQIIHDNDVEKLKELLAERPALLSWRGGRNRLAMQI
jgi:hypothetical protein